MQVLVDLGVAEVHKLILRHHLDNQLHVFDVDYFELEFVFLKVNILMIVYFYVGVNLLAAVVRLNDVHIAPRVRDALLLANACKCMCAT